MMENAYCGWTLEKKMERRYCFRLSMASLILTASRNRSWTVFSSGILKPHENSALVFSMQLYANAALLKRFRLASKHSANSLIHVIKCFNACQWIQLVASKHLISVCQTP